MNVTKKKVSFDETETQGVRGKFENSFHKRKADLSPAEAFFLHALLVDAEESTGDSGGNRTPDNTDFQSQMKRATQVLDDDILFSVPEALVEDESREKDERRQSFTVSKRRPSKTLPLWHAYEEGVAPNSLAKRGSFTLKAPFQLGDMTKDSLPAEASASFPVDDDDEDNIPSDEEVRHEKREDDASSDSSWEDTNHRDHYSAWEVFKDEYAADFGFDYTAQETIANILNDTDENANSFRIIGTSADDTSAHPHVLSPPLMDSLTNFLPEVLVGQNFWLKVRPTGSQTHLKDLYCFAE